MMKQTMHKSTTSAIWLAAVAVIALVAKPTSAWAQNPKTFTEYVNAIIETQQEQDEPEGERVFFTPYLTNDTHYMVISDISINTLYNVCEGAFCVMDNNLLTVWSVDGRICLVRTGTPSDCTTPTRCALTTEPCW